MNECHRGKADGRRLVWICWKDIRHPEAGGAELVMHEISTRLVRDGWTVIHLVPGFRDCLAGEVIDGIQIIRIGRSILSFYRLPLYFWRHLRSGTMFLVDAFISVGSLACLTMKPAQAAVVVYHIEHTKWFSQTRVYGVPRWLMPFLNVTGFFMEKLQLILIGLCFRGAVVTISPSTAGELVRLGFRKECIRILSLGSASKPLEALTCSLPKERNFTVLMIGPRTGKRPMHTLKAFVRFQRSHPDAHFWVAGWGSELGAMRTYVEQHEVRNVTFLGRVSDAERNALLQRAHVLCTSPLREGWGLIVIEANAMGTPVIGYDVPGLRDALAFSNGWLCAARPQNMAEQMDAVYTMWAQQPEEYEEVRENCLNASKRFSFDNAYEQFSTVLPAAPGDPSE